MAGPGHLHLVPAPGMDSAMHRDAFEQPAEVVPFPLGLTRRLWWGLGSAVSPQ